MAAGAPLWRSSRRAISPAYLNKGPAILQGYGDRVYGRKIEGTAVEKSLELIHPENLWWWIREESGQTQESRRLPSGQCYPRLLRPGCYRSSLVGETPFLPAGIYPHSYFFGGKPSKTLLTVSLSEPFEGFHYKLVAGVVCLSD